MKIPADWPRLLLIALSALNVAWGAFVFMGFLGLDPLAWLMVNVCAPSEAIAVAGLWTRNRGLMGFSVPLLLVFGFGGLFVFSWGGYMLQAQLNHLLMTITAMYIVYDTLGRKEKSDSHSLIRGMLAGILAAVLMQAVVHPWYFANAPESVTKLLADMGYQM